MAAIVVGGLCESDDPAGTTMRASSPLRDKDGTVLGPVKALRCAPIPLRGTPSAALTDPARGAQPTPQRRRRGALSSGSEVGLGKTQKNQPKRDTSIELPTGTFLKSVDSCGLVAKDRRAPAPASQGARRSRRAPDEHWWRAALSAAFESSIGGLWRGYGEPRILALYVSTYSVCLIRGKARRSTSAA